MQDQLREGLGIPNPHYEARVEPKERAKELGLPDPTTILTETGEYLSSGVTVDQDLLKEKKMEFYRSMKEHEPEIWEFMKQNNGMMTQEQWESLPIEILEQARAVATLQAPKKELGFDYTTGVGTTTNDAVKFSRFTLSRLDTNTEKEDYLNLTVGYDGWTTDKFGRYALTQKGIDILGLPALQPDEKGRVIDEYQGFTGYDWVDAAPHILMTVPAVATSVALNPYGTVIGLLGGGIAMGGAYLGDEAIEYAQGWSNQSAESIARMTAEYGMYGLLGEFIGRSLRPFGRMISDPQSGLFKFRPSAPYTRAGVLKAYPGLENDIRAMYSTKPDGTPLPEVEIQKLVNKAIKHLRFKTPLTGDTNIPGAADPFNPNALVSANTENARRQIIKDILEGNGTYSGVPGIDVATNRPLIARFQGMLDTVFNRPRDDINRRYLNHTMLLLQGKAAGLSDDALKNYAAKFGTEEELVALKDLSQKIIQRATDSSQSYDDTLNMILQNIEKETDEAIATIRSSTGLLPDDTAVALAERLKQVKYSNDTAIEGFALHLDESLNGTNLFDTTGLKNIALRIENSLPKTTKEVKIPGQPGETETITVINTKLPYVKEIFDLVEGIKGMGNRVNASEMYQYEKLFEAMKGEIAEKSGLIEGRYVEEALSSINNSFKQGKGVLENNIKKLSPKDKSKFKESFSILENMNKLRTESKGMFDDVFVAKMIKDAASGAQGFLETKDIVTHFITSPGRHKAFLSLMNALPASEREIIKAGISRHTFDDMLNQSLNKITNEYEGSGFLNAWKVVDDKTKKVLFGTQTNKIDTLAKEIAAKNGKFSDKEIAALLNAEESNITKLLNQKLKLIAEQDANFSKGWMKKLLSDEVETEQVIDFIFRPKSANKITQAKEFLSVEGAVGQPGITPPLWNEFREAAMLKILQKVGSDATDPGLGPIFNGPKFRNALDSYGKETLDAMFGAELRKDLYKFADQVTLLTSKNMSGGLVAANVALSPIRKGKSALPPLAAMKIFSYLMNKPGFVEYLTFGIKNPYTRKGADALAKISTYASAGGVQEKLALSEGRQTEILPVDQPGIVESIMNAPGEFIDKAVPDTQEIPVSNLNVNPASRLASAFNPTGGMDPNTMARGQQLFNRPGEITFASKGGIMSTNKAFQRVA